MVHITDFRVIIVGGSSADRALAHSLQRCAIDLVVLEANDNIAHQVGASIGILTTGPGSGINLPLQLKAMSRSQVQCCWASQFPWIWLLIPLSFMIKYLRPPVAKLLPEIQPDALGTFLPALIAGYYGPPTWAISSRRLSPCANCFNAIWQAIPHHRAGSLPPSGEMRASPPTNNLRY
ncbi:hypothetical protein BDV27DRAFT_153985 [Aspergillus caelatus]|uniref:Uncharacterized protein n=1 Tax=Aspergillus caelatus TaxID=61420 RepID=A0A5N7AF25_9EURO|nr:uncharacterized protein BDV27DRAFT_153985 [Aspergillus caelatus]KAE8368432.1 hypothetical protein BDV27DRAFT_153985 [Aspergillus caelatus]